MTPAGAPAAPPRIPDSEPDSMRLRRPWLVPAIGLGIALLLIAVAILLPLLTGWDVNARSKPEFTAAPLHAGWRRRIDRLYGPGTIPTIVIAVLSWRYAFGLASRLPWRRLLLVAYLAGLAWMFALALVDGPTGISRVLGNPYEYLQTAREIIDIPAMLQEYISRIPYSHPDNWVTHIAGHPPGALLFFIGLVKLGLGSDFAAGVVVIVLAATTPLAVFVTLRALGVEHVARRIAPFLVFAPSAIYMAVSADAVFTVVSAWGIAALVLGATATNRTPRIAWSALAGLLLGVGVMMSYGLPLIGLVAVAVLIAARSWIPLPIAALVAAGVVLSFAAAGFAYWDAYPVLVERYYDGIASDRPFSYWVWGNLAALAVSAGPILGAGLASLIALRGRADRVVLLLVAGAVAIIVLADVSGMSKAEVERIWLPFIPWLLVSTAALPDRWLRPGLAVQVTLAFVVQQAMYTTW